MNFILDLKNKPVRRTVSIATVVLIILVVLFANGMLFGFPNRATAANAPVGLIIAWPSTEVSIPSGWARVAGFDDYFFEGTTANPSALASGSATHGHNSPTHTHGIGHTHTGTTGGSTGTVVAGANTQLTANSHLHNITTAANIGNNNPASSSFGTSSNSPPYLEVIWIESDGTTPIPDGALALFNSDTLPSSWSRQAGN